MTSPVNHVSKDSSLRNTYVAMDTNSFLLFKLGLCDNGKTYILIMPIMHYKIISITIVIAIKL